MTAPRTTPSTTVTVSAQKVDRTERSLVHSERSTSPKVDARKAARWSGPARAIVASVIGSPGRLVLHALSGQCHERLLQRGPDGDGSDRAMPWAAASLPTSALS